MGTMTATEFAKNLKKALDRLEFGGEAIIIIGNNHKIWVTSSRVDHPHYFNV